MYVRKVSLHLWKSNLSHHLGLQFYSRPSGPPNLGSFKDLKVFMLNNKKNRSSSSNQSSNSYQNTRCPIKSDVPGLPTALGPILFLAYHLFLDLQPLPRWPATSRMIAGQCEKENPGSSTLMPPHHSPRLEAILLLSIINSTSKGTSLLHYNNNKALISSDFREQNKTKQDALVLNSCFFFSHNTRLL